MVALAVAGLLVLLLAALAAAYWYSLSLPGVPYTGPSTPPTAAETELAERLRRHVVAIASEPHNVGHYPALEHSAAYIEGELKALGYVPQSQVKKPMASGAQHLRRVGTYGASPAMPSLVIGAHYDSAGIAPGANHNASGSAAVLELARLLKGMPLTDKRLLPPGPGARGAAGAHPPRRGRPDHAADRPGVPGQREHAGPADRPRQAQDRRRRHLARRTPARPARGTARRRARRGLRDVQRGVRLLDRRHPGPRPGRGCGLAGRRDRDAGAARAPRPGGWPRCSRSSTPEPPPGSTSTAGWCCCATRTARGGTPPRSPTASG